MLSLILACLADPLIIPTHVPEPTPADVRRAEAMARQFGGLFPGGELNPTAPVAAPEGVIPVGTWTRSYRAANSGTAALTACPGGLKFTLVDSDAAGVRREIRLRADCARSGQTLYGVVTHVEVSNLGVKALGLEGAPFAASVRVADGKLLVGRVRFDAGDSGEDLSVLMSGSYDSAARLAEWPGPVRTLQSTAGWLGVGR